MIELQKLYIMKQGLSFCLFLGVSGLFLACTKPSGLASKTCMNTILIGEQVWTTKNLNVEEFRNGDPIPEVKTNEAWIKSVENKQPAWCYYENIHANGAKHGKLYNWYAINDQRGLAPKGFHIATEAEWSLLIDYFGNNLEGVRATSKEDEITAKNSGLSVLYSGRRDPNGKFHDIDLGGFWWCIEEGKSIYHMGLGLRENENEFVWQILGVGCGYSVRCVRD